MPAWLHHHNTVQSWSSDGKKGASLFWVGKLEAVTCHLLANQSQMIHEGNHVDSKRLVIITLHTRQESTFRAW